MIFIRALETAINNNSDETEELYHDNLRVRINYAFAHRLKHYILEKSVDKCMLFKNSPEDATRSMSYFVTYYTPKVVIYIDCAYDVDKSVHGYHILCDKYTTLVKTIAYETHMQEQEFTYEKEKDDGTTEEVTEVLQLTPDNTTGYSVDRKLTYGSIADIQINIGYISSTLDSQYLNDDVLTDNPGVTYEDEEYSYHLVEGCTLDLVAKRIVEGSYGPPIIEYENNDPVGNTDPYFYSISDWVPYIADDNSSGEIVSELYNNIPINSLKIIGNNELLYLGEDSKNYTENYTWQSWCTYDAPTSCHFICSYKTNGVDVVAYIAIGDYVFTKTLNSIDYTVLNFTVDVNPFDDIRIGVEGIGTIWFTGIWLSPKEVIGNIDDPRSKYSMYPPGYRTRTSNSVPVYNGSDPITVAITSATDLVGRASELVSEDSVESEEDTSSVDDIVSQYTSVANSVLSQSANQDLTDAKIILSPASLANAASSAASSLMSKASSVTNLLGKFMLISAASSMFSTSNSASQESWSAPADWKEEHRNHLTTLWNNYAKAKNEWLAAKDKKKSDEKSEKEAKENKEEAVKQANKEVETATKNKESAKKDLDAANTAVSNREKAIAATSDPAAKKILEDMLVNDKESQAAAQKKYDDASSALEKAQENKNTAYSNASKSTDTATKDKVTTASIEELEKKKDEAKKAFDDRLKDLKDEYKKEAKAKKDISKQYNEKLEAEEEAKNNLDKAKQKSVELNNQVINYTLKLQDSSTSASELNKISSKLSSTREELTKVNNSIPNLEKAYDIAVKARKDFYDNNKEKLS